MRIGITGSWRERDRDTWGLGSDHRSFKAACRELGSALAKAGVELTVGSDSESTADKHVVEGYLSSRLKGRVVRVIRPKRDKSSTPFASLYKKHPRAFVFLTGPTSHWRHTRHMLVEDIDALITVGGADGTYQAGLELKLTRKRLLPIGAFGGASSRLLNELLLSAPAQRPALEALANPWSAKGSVKKVLAILDANRPPKVLIVHGHGRDRVGLHKWLRKHGIADSTLMGEFLSPGETLPEKFEGLAAVADAAIALATPDDIAGPGAVRRNRARQNVWVEVGWFWGRLGRRRLLLLVRGDIEIPSDLDGLEFFTYRRSPLALKAKIREFLAYVARSQQLNPTSKPRRRPRQAASRR